MGIVIYDYLEEVLLNFQELYITEQEQAGLGQRFLFQGYQQQSQWEQQQCRWQMIGISQGMIT